MEPITDQQEAAAKPWTIKDVAAYLHCSERHVHNLIGDGLPHFRIRRLLRFWPDEVRGYRRARHRPCSQHYERDCNESTPDSENYKRTYRPTIETS